MALLFLLMADQDWFLLKDELAAYEVFRISEKVFSNNDKIRGGNL